MIFNQQPPTQGGGGGVTLHNVSASEDCIYFGGYEDGGYVGSSLVSSADLPEGAVVLFDAHDYNPDVACADYPDGGFTEVINTIGSTHYFMMPPYDCWIIYYE